ncbi:MAG: hypothetical protein B7Z55_05430 [Planctomycetales bacterium 12-60-4]|nr:MAG: hypothetical protein B7Z55_05430 [Planctomycetales bacterium 12-60-4]
MGSTPSVKRNVMASWFAHGVTIVIGFFLMPYIVRVLGDQAYGRWVFINSMASYAGLLYFGFGDTISRYVAKYQAAREYQRLNEVVSLVLAIYLLMGGVAVVIGCGLCAAAPWLTTWEGGELLEIRLTILVLTFNVAVGLAGSVFGGVLMGLRRFDVERTISFSTDIVRLALVLLFLQREWGILTIALIYSGITIVENVAYMVLAFRFLPELSVKRSHLSWTTFQECFSFSSMAFINAIGYQMTNATDSVVIGIAMGTDKIVPYYIALRLTQFIRQPIDRMLKAFGMVLLLTTGMFVGAWFFGGAVIEAWMGEGYDQSHHILMLLLAAQIAALPCGVLRAFLFGLGKVRMPAVLYLLEAVCNLVTSIVLVQFWGIVGVAWGTLIPTIAIELGIMLPLALQALGLNYRRLWNEAVAPQLLPIAALAVYSWCIAHQSWELQGWPLLIGVTLGGGAVLGATWLITGRGMQMRAAT